MHHNDTQKSLEDVTDMIMVRDYSCSPVPWPSPEVRVVIPHQVTVDRWAQVHESHSAPQLQMSTKIRDGPRRLSWANLETEDKALPSPPTTPQLRKLESPRLEPVKAGTYFCACHRTEKAVYQQAREKMDSQREFVTFYPYTWRVRSR